MPKRTKAERQKIRREAWKKAGAELKAAGQAALKSSGQGFKDVVGGVIEGIGDRKKTMAGAALQNVGKSLKEGKYDKSLSGVGHVIKAGVNVLKGIFNDPSWRNAYGFDPLLVINKHRPMSPRALSGFTKNQLALGVGHVVDVNFEWPDWSKDEAFILATNEAFREIRLDLKSNLNYTIGKYRCYLLNTIAILIMSKQIERSLGWTKFVEPSIPKVQEIFKYKIPYTATGGISDLEEIKYLSDAQFARSLTRQKVLMTVLSQIQVPDRLQRFVGWIAGSMFFDQSQPNMQIYRTWINSIPIYSVNAADEVVLDTRIQSSEYDIDMVIRFANNLMTEFGIMNADIKKTGSYVDLVHILYEQYQPKALCDYEFFNMLINSWTGDAKADALFNGFFRLDILPNVNDNEAPGLTYGLGAVLTNLLATPIKTLNQGLILDYDATGYWPQGVNISQSVANKTITSTDNIWKFPDAQGNGLAAIVVTSRVVRRVSVSTKATSTGTEYNNVTVTPGVVLQSATAASALQSVTINFDKDSTVSFTLNVGEEASDKYVPIIQSRGVGSLGVELTQVSETIVADLVIYTPAGKSRVSSLTYGTDYTVAVSPYNNVPGKVTFDLKWVRSTSLVITSYTNTNIMELFTTGNVQWLINGYITFALRSTSASGVTIVMDKGHVLEYFTENVDYHIPIMFNEQYTISHRSGDTNTNTVNITTPLQIMKECYIPVMYNTTEADTLSYQIYASLLRIVK